MKIPNYILDRDFLHYFNPQNSITLTSGMFVKPIERRYVPKHILDAADWSIFNDKKRVYEMHDDSTAVFCYTSKGIVLIPRDFIREVN